MNTRHSLGWTALMLAAVNNKYDMCKVLLEKGADPNLGDNYMNPSRTAREKGMHPIDGNYFTLIKKKLFLNLEIKPRFSSEPTCS